jgi:opacity protein-like surface antigen
MTMSMKSFLARLPLAAALSLSTAALAEAQQIRTPYRFLETSQSIGLLAGYGLTGRGQLELGPESAPLGGVRYGIRVSGPFSAEGDVTLLPSRRMVLDTVPGDTALSTRGQADMQILTVHAALRFNVTGPRTYRRLQPYAVAGIGLGWDLKRDDDQDIALPGDVRFRYGTRFLGTLGGGVEWFATDRYSLRVDARNVLWKLNTPPPFLRGQAGLVRPPDQWTQNLYLTLGFSLNL